MRGREFLTLSGLLATVTEEPAIRTRTSRAYYAAYLESRFFCEKQLGYRRTRQSREHQDIPALLRSVDPDVVAYLTFLRSLRNTADYDMDISTVTVAGAVDQAEFLARETIARLDAHAERLERERAEAAESTGPPDV